MNKTLQGQGFHLELRGLLADMKFREVTCIPHTLREHEHPVRRYSVHGTLTVPDRFTGQPTDLSRGQLIYVSVEDARKAGGCFENAAVALWMNDAWKHEFDEGVLLPDGTPINDPEPEHA